VNQCLRPLKSSTSSNLVDMGWCNAGGAATDRAHRSPTLQTDSGGEAMRVTAFSTWRSCRGVAGCRPRQMETNERGNPDIAALAPQGGGLAHRRSSADGDVWGRSPRSSRRPGKPAAWRRRTAGSQHQRKRGEMTPNGDTSWPSLSEAQPRVLSIQRKLHRWSKADCERKFDDLFNLVCDRATLVV